VDPDLFVVCFLEDNPGVVAVRPLWLQHENGRKILVFFKALAGNLNLIGRFVLPHSKCLPVLLAPLQGKDVLG
jgi:hypothetical protein